jgi:hypothetical protein
MMMDELIELRQCIEQGRYNDALLIIGEMDEMAKDDKIDKIGSYMVILLVHLIKQSAERRTTRSWELSIRNAVLNIQKTNKRRTSGGVYMNEDELRATLAENIEIALNYASQEAFEGAYTPKQLAAMINLHALQEQALAYILHGAPELP